MRFLLRAISLRHFGQHPLRTLLTMLGIMLGVALGVGVGLLNDSTLASFNDMVQGLAGKSDLTVTAPGRAGLPEEVLDDVLDTEGVKAAAPSIRVTGFLAGKPSETLMLLGIDALGDGDFRSLKVGGDVDFDPISFLNTPESVIIPRSLALRNGLAEGDTLTVTTRGRNVDLVVRAIVKEEGAAKVYGGNAVILDVYNAQEMFGLVGSFHQIDIILAEGVARETAAARIRDKAGEGVIVEQPGRNRQAEKMIEGLRKTTDMLGMLSLFVGMFLIYNTFSTAVAQRRREIGIMRAMGASRNHVTTLFLSEAFVLGLVGSILGALAGVGLARLLLEQYAATLSNFYFQAHPEAVQLTWPLLIRSVSLGTIAAVVSAVAPARKAASISPLEALSGVALEATRQKNFKWAFVGGLAFLAGEVAILLNSWEESNIEIGVLSALVSFIALALLSPMLILVATKLLHPVNKYLLGLEARMGGDNLTRAAGRTSVTVAALMIGITLAVAMGGAFASLSVSLDEWITEGITADLSVRGSAAIPGANSVELPISLREELAAVPGVQDVGSFRIAPVPLGEGVIHVFGIEVDTFDKYASMRWIEGDRKRDGPKVVDGNYTVISENLSTRFNLHVGDSIEIVGPLGRRNLEIVGVQVDYTSDLGAAMLHRPLYTELFGDPHVDSFSVWLESGVEAVAVRERIRETFPDKQLFMQTNTEFRTEIKDTVRQIFRLADVMQLLVIIIAVVGIVNTLLISIIDRTRELGILRAMGFTREQLSRLIVWEAGIMGLIAGTLGALAGSAFSMSIVHLINRQLVGWSTAFVFPTDSVVKGFFVALIGALIAAWYPARKASRLNVIQAMEYE